MPEAVKISELPPLSSVQPNDIVPVVDELLTQTSKATAAQIAAIGGGPPGVNTVSTDKIQDGAVTAQKIGFSGPNKLISRTASGPGQGLEIPCSPFARGLLAIENAALARDYLDALQSTDNPTFTGQVKVGRGTAASPAIAPAADPETGLFFPESGAVSFSADGTESFRFAPDGTLLTRSPSETILRGRYGAVAWLNFNAAASAGATTNFVAAQHTIAARYGLTLPGAPSAILAVGGSTMQAQAANTLAHIEAIEDARGYDVTFPSTPNFSDQYGKVNYAISPAANSWPAYAKGSGSSATQFRANFTSPGDDKLWYWSGTPGGSGQWLTTPASGKGWLGSMTLTTQNPGTSIRVARGFASVTRTGQGAFLLTFEQPMVDTSYCTLISASGTTDTFVPPVIRITAQSTTAVSFAFQVANSVATYYDPTTVCVAVFR